MHECSTGILSSIFPWNLRYQSMKNLARAEPAEIRGSPALWIAQAPTGSGIADGERRKYKGKMNGCSSYRSAFFFFFVPAMERRSTA